jgi:hypothetical protein
VPTRRTRVSRQLSDGRITPEAIAAWKAGDYWALWAALGLRLFQMPDWNCDPPSEPDDRPESLRRAYPAPDPRALKPLLIELAGPLPRRWVYRNAD